jgi:hypothetical protein
MGTNIFKESPGIPIKERFDWYNLVCSNLYWVNRLSKFHLL